jgi:hypothetical protein
MSTAPKYITLRFELNELTGWYRAEPFSPMHPRIPESLKVEPTFSADLIAQGSREVIHGPKCAGRWAFFTGMRPVRGGWFEGNDYITQHGTKARHLCLFLFSDSDRRLTVFYFPDFFPNIPTRRAQFAVDFADQFERDGFPTQEGQG